MGRVKGSPKTGGRKPGTPNKRISVWEICQSISLNPFEELAKIANAPENERRFDALKELCQYIEPKRKAIEHSTDEEKGFRIIVEDYRSK